MSKWEPIDRAKIKVGDKVKCVDNSTDCVTTHSGIVTEIDCCDIVIGVNGYLHWLTGTWYVRKPKKEKRASADCLNCGGQQCMSCALRHWHDDCEMDCPDCCGDTTPELAPVRPEEPPVGSFFRVDRTGREFYRDLEVSLKHYFHIACDAGGWTWIAWADVTEPGDTITLLELTEKGDKKDGGV